MQTTRAQCSQTGQITYSAPSDYGPLLRIPRTPHRCAIRFIPGERAHTARPAPDGLRTTLRTFPAGPHGSHLPPPPPTPCPDTTDTTLIDYSTTVDYCLRTPVGYTVTYRITVLILPTTHYRFPTRTDSPVIPRVPRWLPRTPIPQLLRFATTTVPASFVLGPVDAPGYGGVRLRHFPDYLLHSAQLLPRTLHPFGGTGRSLRLRPSVDCHPRPHTLTLPPPVDRE